ncbi:unnamed protein product [Rangifer tarandus platyrhynchus]|uniref:Uncharacterized protein n=2 Tax=Rangifer tarandus platyrhynchus TaxID=3082113 RepID=A0AC59Z8G4_RANTA|nr:unnamed protein product [Rangifer tarandus platyrhynchus]
MDDDPTSQRSCGAESFPAGNWPEASGAAGPAAAAAAAAVSSLARLGRRRLPWGPRDRLRREEGVGSRLPEAAAAAWSRAGVGPRSGNARRPEAVT